MSEDEAPDWAEHPRRPTDGPKETPRQRRTNGSGGKPEAAAQPNLNSKAAPLCCDHFVAYRETGQFINLPTGTMWPASSVDASVPPIDVGETKLVPASKWLVANRHVEQMTCGRQVFRNLSKTR